MKTNLYLTFFGAFILLNFFSNKVNAQSLCKEVIGYYPGWQWYDRVKLVRPETIDYDNYSIINYAFLYPLPDGSIQITDPWGDKNLLLGSINWSVAPSGYDSAYDLGNPAYHNPNTSLVYYAHLNNTKIMISIGGWTLSNDFPAIAADPVKRTNFAHWCNQVVRIYQIDGIDIDWEYPGYADHMGTPADMGNYTLLLQEVRDSLDAIDSNLLLTAAFGAGPDRMDDIEWNQMVTILDYINLMSYDFFGAFSPSTNHNSPLYAPAEGDPTFNCNSAVERLINDYDVPSEMINLGVAFYGRSTKTLGTPGLHVPTTGTTDAVTFALDEGSPQYYNVMDKIDLFNENWDDLAGVPYLTGVGTLQTFVSYDNEKSIGLKGQYVVDMELAGVIIWEITGDYIETATGSGIIAGTPLADTLNLSLCHPPTAGSGGNVGVLSTSSSTFTIYPNPVGELLIVSIPEKFLPVTQEIQIINSIGEIVITTPLLDGGLDVSSLKNGVYILQITASNQTQTLRFIKN